MFIVTRIVGVLVISFPIMGHLTLFSNTESRLLRSSIEPLSTKRLNSLGIENDDFKLHVSHTTLPLGSWVKIENPENSSVVVAQVSDRGPYGIDHDLSLSFATASRLGFDTTRSEYLRIQRIKVAETGDFEYGTPNTKSNPKTVEFNMPKNGPAASSKPVVSKDQLPTRYPSSKQPYFSCQVGVYLNPDNAEVMVERCEDLGYIVFTENVKVKESFATKIFVGRFPDRILAERQLNKLRIHGIGHPIVIMKG